MKKLWLLGIVFLVLVSFVSAVPSTDRTDYYRNATNVYITDGVSSDDYDIFGNVASDEDTCANHGWK